MVASEKAFQTAVAALRLGIATSVPEDYLPWTLIAEFLGCTATPERIQAVARGVSEHRGPVTSETFSGHELASWRTTWPAERADMTGWNKLGRAYATGALLRDWWRSRYHCEALVVAYLLGMDVSDDIHWACRQFGIESAHSENSNGIPSPAPFVRGVDSFHIKRAGA